MKAAVGLSVGSEVAVKVGCRVGVYVGRNVVVNVGTRVSVEAGNNVGVLDGVKLGTLVAGGIPCVGEGNDPGILVPGSLVTEDGTTIVSVGDKVLTGSKVGVADTSAGVSLAGTVVSGIVGIEVDPDVGVAEFAVEGSGT